MAIWIASGSLLVAIFALTVSVRQHITQKELTLSVEKNRVYQAVVSGRLLAVQLSGLGDAITDLEDQVGLDATTVRVLTEWKDILAEAGLPEFFPPPPASWKVIEKIFGKLQDSLDDPEQEQSPASYHELFGSVEALVKVMQLASDRMIAKRDRLKRKTKEND